MDTPEKPQERLCLSRAEAATALGVSRSKFREMLTRKEVREVRVGRRSLIPRAELDRFVAERI